MAHSDCQIWVVRSSLRQPDHSATTRSSAAAVSETTLNSRSAEEDESTNDTGLELANACGDVTDDNVERELREEEAREAQADAAGGLRIEDARLRPVVGCITSVVSSCRLSRRRN
mgnify:CR=1 FL=1